MVSSNSLASANNRPAKSSGITEIMLSNKNQDFAMVLPMLAHLSKNSGDKWLTWVSREKLTKTQLQGFDFDLDKIRVIQAANDEESIRICTQALSHANSGNVVVNLGYQLSEKDRQILEKASEQSGSRGLILAARH